MSEISQSGLASKIKKGLIISFGKYLDFKTFNFTRLILKIFATVSINWFSAGWYFPSDVAICSRLLIILLEL